MQLSSSDGASLELNLAGYQYGHNPQARTGTDWDANWLLVHGEVHAADATAWTFTDACLTTWEARSITAWLHSAAAGGIPVTDRPREEDILQFTEPNLAFSLQQHTASRAIVRVHFSLEALPPALQVGRRPAIFDYHVAIDVSISDLTAAADAWDQQCSAFPIR